MDAADQPLLDFDGLRTIIQTSPQRFNRIKSV